MISSAMILNRGINFYLLVIVSGVVSTINALRDKKEESLNIEESSENLIDTN